MPALHPLNNYIKTGRQKMDILFHTDLKNGSKLVLGQSHEEVVVPLMQKHILSYKDLPVCIYQFQTKFRNELRAKSGIMRGREFLMKDLYSFHLTEEDLNNYYKQVQKAYFKIFKRVGLLESTYLTYASGGTFSKYSHEFQTISDAGEDLIYICKKCNLAINEEIIKEQSKCPNCGEKDLESKKSIEVGNIFKLKTKFSSPFNFSINNEDGVISDLIMGCYGIGLGRLMGTVVETFHDNDGIIWPNELSPFKAHLVAINLEDANIKRESDKIYKELLDNDIEVLYDDRLKFSAGEKFSESDMIGCSYRIIVSKKNIKNGMIEVRNRLTGIIEFIGIDELLGKMNLA